MNAQYSLLNQSSSDSVRGMEREQQHVQQYTGSRWSQTKKFLQRRPTSCLSTTLYRGRMHTHIFIEAIYEIIRQLKILTLFSFFFFFLISYYSGMQLLLTIYSHTELHSLPGWNSNINAYKKGLKNNGCSRLSTVEHVKNLRAGHIPKH
jgi:hypothetical protein